MKVEIKEEQGVVNMLSAWHESKAMKYSKKMYPMREDYYLYKFYKAKFDYHIFMMNWYSNEEN
jgi:hypothetical protein